MYSASPKDLQSVVKTVRNQLLLDFFAVDYRCIDKFHYVWATAN